MHEYNKLEDALQDFNFYSARGIIDQSKTQQQVYTFLDITIEELTADKLTNRDQSIESTVKKEIHAKHAELVKLLMSRLEG